MEIILGKEQAAFYYEEQAYPGVQKIADKVRKDVERVTDFFPGVATNSEFVKYMVFFGTIGISPILEKMTQDKKINLSVLQGKREVFLFQLVEHPMENVDCALVIAGSDKRGTIYGLFHLSECMGVSPLVDWSDVRPEKQKDIILTESVNMVSREPSVKYRGIFINDEWPAFGSWCDYHFGGFNAQMYEHVFELILRLKGNYLWPAMWSACFSMDGPGLQNAELADELGIVIGSSHHEPCMRNGEEYRYLRGEGSIYGNNWDFRKNPEGIKKFWKDGLNRNRNFENVITLGMRGENDTPILGGQGTLQDNIDLLRDVLKLQNQLIQENINENLCEVPRVFVLFTEVEAFFYGDADTKGLINDEQLDGVTLMLSDDNFGNLRSVPNEQIRKHKGGYGLYYHFDFHGGSYAYDWMNTNHLPKVWEQLTMAYDYGIQDIWVVNIGDICFLEYPACYFFELAYDMEKWGSSRINCTEEFTKKWITQQFHVAFDEKDKVAIHEILDGYTKINHNRKPEILNASVYHPVHYGEAQSLLDKAAQITQMADSLKKKCPEWILPAFYELIYFPAVASVNILRMQLLAGRNKLYAEQNRVEANDLADEIAYCIGRDRELTDELHQINSNKWYGMGLSEHIGFVSWLEEGNRYPLMIRIEPANKPRIIVAKSEDAWFTEGFPWTGKTLYITDFLRPDIKKVRLDIALGSREPVEYQIVTECPWLSFSKTSGCVEKKDVIIMKIDRSLLKGKATGEAFVITDGAKVHIVAEAENYETDYMEPMTFLECDGYIAMEAEHYWNKQDVESGGFQKIKNYGRTLSAMKVLPPKNDFTNAEERPYLEYRFIARKGGEYQIDFYLAPSNTPYMDHKLCLGFQMNDSACVIENTVSKNFRSLDCSCQEWVSAVRDNIRIHRSKVKCKKGSNNLRIYAVSSGLVIERIILCDDVKKLAESYLGPVESFYINDNKGE